MAELLGINRTAHEHFLHPNKIRWQKLGHEREIDFLAKHLVGQAGEHQKMLAYIYKELTQLAEIEMHVAVTMLRIIGDGVSSKADEIWMGADLVHTLSCFAAEEIQHANTFYQYVRALTGHDLARLDNLFAERLAVYDGGENPLVKLAALSATAYIGESVITVFETRMKALDPGIENSFTHLLHLHGLDEARHIKTDHFVIDEIVPRFSAAELRQMQELIAATEQLNGQLAHNCAAAVQQLFGVDYTQGNDAAGVQASITQAFRAAILQGGMVRRVDQHLDRATKSLLAAFSMTDRVHA